MISTNTIKAIQDIMRKDTGVDGDAQRISQQVWMLFLKIFDDKEKEYELLDPTYKSPVPEELRWRNWAADDEGITGDALLDFVNNKLFRKLKELSFEDGDDPRGFIVKEVFQDGYNYMKSGTLMRQVINKINKDFDFNNLEDRHLFNDIYEKILNDLQSAGNAGEYYTPRAVTDFIVEMVNPKLGDKILDPACGTGGFLVSALKHIRKNEVKTAEDNKILQESIYGIDKKPLPHLLCTTNMILNGVEVPRNIKRDNALTKPIRDYVAKDKVDVVITNPPFGGTEEDGVENNFPANLRTKETADLFLVLIVKLLKDGGRCGMVLPDGSLSGEGVKQRIRQMLLEECNLHTIIRLPNSVFKPYATVKTNLLFFEKGSPTKEVWFFEHPYPFGVKSYNKTNPVKLSEFELEKSWWNNRIKGENSWRVSIDEIAANKFNLDIKNPNKKADDVSLDPSELIENLGNDLNQINILLKEIWKKNSLADMESNTIGELCNVVKGKTGIKKATPGDYPLVVTAQDRLSHNDYQIEGNAVCIPLVSSTGHGHASINRLHYQTGKFALGSILAAVIPKDETKLDAEYLYLYLTYFKDSILVPLMKGGVNVSLSVDKIKSVEIKIPHLQQQKEIIRMANKIQDVEGILNKSKDKAKLLMKAIMQKSFQI